MRVCACVYVRVCMRARACVRVLSQQWINGNVETGLLKERGCHVPDLIMADNGKTAKGT